MARGGATLANALRCNGLRSLATPRALGAAPTPRGEIANWPRVLVEEVGASRENSQNEARGSPVRVNTYTRDLNAKVAAA